MDCQTVQNLLAGDILDDLPEAERRSVTEHTAQCGPCREHLRDLLDTWGRIPMALTAQAPSADVWQKLQSRLDADT